MHTQRNGLPGEFNFLLAGPGGEEQRQSRRPPEEPIQKILFHLRLLFEVNQYGEVIGHGHHVDLLIRRHGRSQHFENRVVLRIDQDVVDPRRRGGVNERIGRRTDDLPGFQRSLREFRSIEISGQIDRLCPRGIVFSDVLRDDLERTHAVFL